MARTATSRAMSAIFFAVSGYWLISISMVFLNKTLLSGEEHKLDAPLFITWYQCVCTVIACYVLGTMGNPNIPRFELKRDIVKQIVPLSCVFTAMIVFNNLCLKYVEVSFYQVARSLTIVFNVIFDFIVLGQRTSLPATLCCALVVSGFLVGNQNELRWSLQGVVFGVTSSFFVAMNAIYMKKKYPLVNNDPWRLTLYNNANAVVLFLPLIIMSGEPQKILMSPNIYRLSFWGMMSIAGVFGVLISFAAAAQVKYTSPLTHNVSATAKAAAQTVIALAVYKNPINFWGGLSVAIVLVGSLFYTLVRRTEMKKKMAEEGSAASSAKTSTAERENLLPETHEDADKATK